MTKQTVYAIVKGATTGLTYLGWDDASRRPAALIIAEAAEVYRARFGKAAKCVHVCPGIPTEGVALRVIEDQLVKPGNWWLTRE